jgi:hypothetical protein
MCVIRDNGAMAPAMAGGVLQPGGESNQLQINTHMRNIHTNCCVFFNDSSFVYEIRKVSSDCEKPYI